MELTLDQALLRAVEAHKAGNIQEANRFYKNILRVQPMHADANHNMGVLAIGLGKAKKALPFFKAALDSNPSNGQFWLSYIEVLIRLDRLVEAKSVLDQARTKGADGKRFDQLEEKLIALSASKTDKAPIVNKVNSSPSNILDKLKVDQAIKLARKKSKQGSSEEAKRIYRDILRRFPKNKRAADGIKVLASRLGGSGYKVQDPSEEQKQKLINFYKQGQFQGLLEKVSILLGEFPSSSFLHNIVGAVYKEIGQLDASIAAYKKALSIKPNDAGAYNNMGVSLKEQGKLEESIEAYGKAIALQPNYADAYYNMGNALQSQGKLEEAIEAYKKALSIKPNHAETYYVLGYTFQDQGKVEEAIEAYRKAITIEPDHARAHNNIGIALQDQGKLKEAVDAYNKAIKMDPELICAYSSYLHQKASMCDWQNFDMGELNNYLAMCKNGKIDHPIEPFPFLYSEPAPEKQLKLSELFATNKFESQHPPQFVRPNLEPQKLRIAYFSPDFRDHPVAQMIEGVLRHHDRNKFEIFAYSFGKNLDNIMRQKIINSTDVFRDVKSLNERDIAILAREDCIDIAIDLGGYTRNAKPEIFNYRAAPVQINYLGYPGSMGADFMDYIIADKILIPPEMEVNYSEKVIFMPDSYQPTNDKLVVGELTPTRNELGLPENAFVFCAINQGYKIKEDEFDIWMRLLSKVKGSVLWLKNQNKWMVSNLQNEALRRGIDPSRLVFAKRIPHEQYLAQFKNADLYLDTFNYNAGTTASDVLMAGLPIVTKMGKSYASRMAASLLNAADMQELITETPKEYEALALALAINRNKLNNVRATLQKNTKVTPIFKTKLYTSYLEEGLKKAYKIFYSGNSTQNIEVKVEAVRTNAEIPS